MFENELNPRPQRHPVLSLIIILLMVGLGFAVVGPMIGFVFALPFYPGNLTDFYNGLLNPGEHPEVKIPLYIVQGFSTLIGLILVPIWYIVAQQKAVSELSSNRRFEIVPVILTIFIVIIFMAVNSVFIEWNANFHFPDFLKDFEVWAKEREDLAGELTRFLTQLDNFTELLVALLVIAVLPGIGEELVFRGLIQNELFRATKNIHVSIWVAAILFSAIHFQFFGFVPRLLLGALFGYLYYWSGSLGLAMLAHFVNNGMSVIAMYFYQRGAFEYDIDSSDAAPANVVIMSTLITAGLLYYFYQYFKNRQTSRN